MKQLKTMGVNIAYYVTVFVSVAARAGMVILGIFFIMSILDQSALNGDSLTKKGVFMIAGFIISMSLDGIFSYLRINIREKVEFDTDGNKKKSSYKYLSAKEKREIDKQRLSDQERLIGIGELKKVTHRGSKEPEAELNKMVGLQEVKKTVLELKAKMEYDKLYKRKKKESIASMHMCFLGSPGTGKTTVARIMAGLLYKYGYIKENKSMEVDASFLKGQTPDATLKRTKIVLDRAKGGVLFIDEAYSLLNGINGSELIAELVKHMEDSKDDFVLILAGYEDNMKELIDSNPGLYSRIGKYLWFKDYDINELKDIFTAVANDAGYCVSAEAYEKFESRITKEKRGKNFGNARSVKNVFQESLDRHAYNIMNGIIGKDKAYVITGTDVEIESLKNNFFNQ